MCQLSNTVTNNDMKQGNFGTIYNFKHSIKKKKEKDTNKAELVLYSRAAAECMYMGYAKLEGAEEGACWFLGVPSGRGAVGAPPGRGFGGDSVPASSCRAARRDWAAQALVAVGRCGKLVPSKAAWLHGRAGERFIYVPVLSQPPSRSRRRSPVTGTPPRRGGRGQGCRREVVHLPILRYFGAQRVQSLCVAVSCGHWSCSCKVMQAIAQPGRWCEHPLAPL